MHLLARQREGDGEGGGKAEEGEGGRDGDRREYRRAGHLLSVKLGGVMIETPPCHAIIAGALQLNKLRMTLYSFASRL